MNDPKIEMISQPLLTEEGFINPACMNELEGAIRDMPKIHDRLAQDPEWGRQNRHCISRSYITGAFAMWACRQSPYGVPDGLEKVCKYLDACLKTAVKWDADGFAHLSFCEISKLLYDILYEQGVSEFDAWNRCKKGATPDFSFVSAYDGPSDPDRDFIDLDALLSNVCRTLLDERRASDALWNKVVQEQQALKEQNLSQPPI